MVKGTPVGANGGVVGWMEMGKAEADGSPNSVEKKKEGGGGTEKDLKVLTASPIRGAPKQWCEMTLQQSPLSAEKPCSLSDGDHKHWPRTGNNISPTEKR